METASGHPHNRHCSDVPFVLPLLYDQRDSRPACPFRHALHATRNVHARHNVSLPPPRINRPKRDCPLIARVNNRLSSHFLDEFDTFAGEYVTVFGERAPDGGDGEPLGGDGHE